MHKITAAVVLPILLILLSFSVHAASLSLTNIGALSTGGVNYPEWWYTGLNPTLRGTAENNAKVTITIDETSFTATASESGAWSLATTMPQGDYDVVIASGGETINVKLHIGQYLPTASGGTTAPETTQSTTPVPDTGSNQLPIIIGSLGLVTLAAYYSLYGRQNALKAFEKQATR